MVFDVIVATGAVALLSIVGVVLFGSDKRLVGLERYVIPMAVGVFLALVLTELLPEVLFTAGTAGMTVVGLSFVVVYILAHVIHERLHAHAVQHNEKQEAALLILFGDALHNFADGVIIAGGFLIAPEIGFAVAAAVALHELPQEIVEFGVLIRAGYTRTQAMVRNLLSASTIIVGGVFALWFAGQFADWLWVLMAFVAGNLLYVAASELLPRLHGSVASYSSFVGVVLAMVLGYGVTAGAIVWSHENVLPEGVHEHDHAAEAAAADHHIDHTHEDEVGHVHTEDESATTAGHEEHEHKNATEHQPETDTVHEHEGEAHDEL